MNLFELPDVLMPFAIAVALLAPLVSACRPRQTRWAVVAAAPVLALACATPFDVRADLVLLGARWGITPINAPFLLLSGSLWIAATWFARHYMEHGPHPDRYHVFHRLAMTGNFGLILAQDLATFYFFFAMMSLSSYPLVIHDGRSASRRAGRVYLALALLGEVVQFAAFSALAAHAGSWTFDAARAVIGESTHRSWLLNLLMAGFGIKAALVPLHVWLPLAHPVAPTPASAVLSGSMIKAGLLGWLNVFPLGEYAAPLHGEALIYAGLVGMFGAAVVGVTQRQPKAVLAYSSVSQMGLMIVAIGIGLAQPAAFKLVLPAVHLYALHHALAKGALFLGVGMATGAPRGRSGHALLWIGLAAPALALAGFPLSSGAVAKVFLKYAASQAPSGWSESLPMLLSLGAVGTTLLMARFLWMLRGKIAREPDEHHSLASAIWVPWLLLVVLVLTLPWWLAFQLAPDKAMAAVSSKQALLLCWPILVGAAIAASAIAFVRREVPEAPPGDLLAIPTWIAARLVGFYRLHRPTVGARVRAADEARAAARTALKNLLRALAGAERYLRTFGVAGIALALLTALLIWRLSV
jgi:formate hydrogenlyase subunit 3/multisubunit Na+/H+ antiporter MnhD subunit